MHRLLLLSIVLELLPVRYGYELGYRWGSCGHKGDLYFHWRVAMLPPVMIEYVVVHELVHLIEAHHTTAFWDRVERIVSDWCDRKQWLAENGATYDL